MRISIKYEASWRNSFLDGSNNEPLPKNGREFVGSITTLGKRDSTGCFPNFISRNISKDTVMGILNRLIGDQRKLYQSRLCPDYFFAELEPHISFDDYHDHYKPINYEVVYIRNMTGNTDQNSFTGMIKSNHPAFKSDYSTELWGILWLPLSELFSFIMDNSFCVKVEEPNKINLSSVLDRSLYLQKKLKRIDCDDQTYKVLESLAGHFPNENYIEDVEIQPIRLYAAALYIQLDRLEKKYDMKTAYNIRGTNKYLFGYSKRGFNGLRDFMKNFITGKEKPIWGNPYQLKEKRKGEGEVVSLLTKANGTLRHSP